VQSNSTELSALYTDVVKTVHFTLT